jgi:hypothetical protein
MVKRSICDGCVNKGDEECERYLYCGYEYDHRVEQPYCNHCATTEELQMFVDGKGSKMLLCQECTRKQIWENKIKHILL